MNLDGGDKVSIVPFVYTRGTVIVSTLANLSSLSEHATFKSISRRRGGENEN